MDGQIIVHYKIVGCHSAIDWTTLEYNITGCFHGYTVIQHGDVACYIQG